MIAASAFAPGHSTVSFSVFSGAATVWTFLFLLFFIAFAVAWMFGFSPPEVSAWLDAHAALWNAIGGWLWRGFWAAALLLCALIVFAVGLEFFGARAEDAKDTPRDLKGGCCGLIFVAVLGYFAWIAITMPLD